MRRLRPVLPRRELRPRPDAGGVLPDYYAEASSSPGTTAVMVPLAAPPEVRRGVQDRERAALAGYTGGGRPQREAGEAGLYGATAHQLRRPTPSIEAGFLGLGNLRCRVRDWAGNTELSPEHQVTRPFHDEVTFPWVLAIPQEVYAQYNAALVTPFTRR